MWNEGREKLTIGLRKPLTWDCLIHTFAAAVGVRWWWIMDEEGTQEKQRSGNLHKSSSMVAEDGEDGAATAAASNNCKHFPPSLSSPPPLPIAVEQVTTAVYKRKRVVDVSPVNKLTRLSERLKAFPTRGLKERKKGITTVRKIFTSFDFHIHSTCSRHRN